MEWGEVRVLYEQKQREALAATRRERALEGTKERRIMWRSFGSWLLCRWQAFFTKGAAHDHLPRPDLDALVDGDEG